MLITKNQATNDISVILWWKKANQKNSAMFPDDKITEIFFMCDELIKVFN